MAYMEGSPWSQGLLHSFQAQYLLTLTLCSLSHTPGVLGQPRDSMGVRTRLGSSL